jgi:hypothetical protein
LLRCVRNDEPFLLKAVLIYRGIEPAKSHEIDALVGRLSQADPLRLALEPLGRFTPYAVAFRYPGEDLDPSPPERNDIIGWITEIGTALGAATAEAASSCGACLAGRL